MSRWMLVISLAAIVASQGAVMAGFCPTTPPNGLVEILCEDFDTYCAPDQFPGGAGVPVGAKCAITASIDGNDVNLRTVWPANSSCVPCENTLGASQPCTPRLDLIIPELYLDNAILQNGSSYYYASSRPFGARIPCKSIKALGEPVPQHTFKDWSTGESNIARFTANSFGDTKFKAVIGTDAKPLVLTFAMDSLEDAKIFYSNGYVELSYGDPADPLNRANTDYVLSPDCGVSCNMNPARSVKYPVICDVWNPVSGLRFVGCPNPTITLPPKRNALAIGSLPMIHVSDVDKGPCYCGSGAAHGGQNIHPVMFNGQVWYDFRNTTPVAGCKRTWTDMNDVPVPMSSIPTTGVDAPLLNPVTREFVWWQNVLTGGTGSGTVAAGQSPHWITLTIKSTTCKVKLHKIVTTISTGVSYKVTDELDNIPIAYSGPFDSIRLGVGPGGQLASNTSWEVAGNVRSCMTPMVEQGQFIEFDDISLYGGKGWTPAGACCLSPSGACLEDQLPDACLAQSGTPRGGGTTCSDPGIYCCPVPYADADADKDVDADDFAALQLCYTGNQTVSGKCSCFDRNNDKKIDLTDVALFANCATGPGVELVGECP